MPLYEAEPDGAPKGAVVVIQEAFGVNPHIEDVTRRFATAGYHAVAPHLFHRTGSPVLDYDDFAAVMPNLTSLSDDGPAGRRGRRPRPPARRGLVGPPDRHRGVLHGRPGHLPGGRARSARRRRRLLRRRDRQRALRGHAGAGRPGARAGHAVAGPVRRRRPVHPGRRRGATAGPARPGRRGRHVDRPLPRRPARLPLRPSRLLRRGLGHRRVAPDARLAGRPPGPGAPEPARPAAAGRPVSCGPARSTGWSRRRGR